MFHCNSSWKYTFLFIWVTQQHFTVQSNQVNNPWLPSIGMQSACKLCQEQPQGTSSAVLYIKMRVDIAEWLQKVLCRRVLNERFRGRHGTWQTTLGKQKRYQNDFLWWPTRRIHITLLSHTNTHTCLHAFCSEQLMLTTPPFPVQTNQMYAIQKPIGILCFTLVVTVNDVTIHKM